MSATFHLYIGPPARSTEQGFEVSDGKLKEAVQFVRTDEFNARVEQLLDRQYSDFPAQEEACQYIGETLFKTFFSGNVLNSFRSYARPPNVVLHLPADLYALPWEVLRDPQHAPGQFLAVEGSVVRYDADNTSKFKDGTFSPPPKGEMQLLFVLSSSDTRPLPVFRTTNTQLFKFTPVDPATYENFRHRAQDNLERLDGFVFFGHGGIDAKTKDGSYVFVKPSVIGFLTGYPEDLRAGNAVSDVLGQGPNVRLGCVLACESASWAKGKLGFERSLVATLLRNTLIPFVIGMQTEIDYFAARQFMATSLSELERNARVDVAVSAARTEIRAISGGRSNQDWWVPVLYTRTSNFEVYSLGAKRLPEIAPAGRQPLPSTPPASAVDIRHTLAGLFRPIRGLFRDYERNF